MSDVGNYIEIRKIGPEDEADWRACFRAFWAHFDRNLDADLYDLAWQRLSSGTEGMYTIGAFADGQLIGIANVVFHRSFSAEGFDHYLQHLFVVLHARRRGVGRQLIEYIYTLVQHDGGHRVYWNTPADNPAAIALYEEVASFTGFRLYRKEFLRNR